MFLNSRYPQAFAWPALIPFARFWFITLPMLRPALMVVPMLNLLYGMRVFDIAYATTNGGPG
jgi:raffinose/stachyose/melibiose transport system permease protein